jgi:hypothetical protein
MVLGSFEIVRGKEILLVQLLATHEFMITFPDGRTRRLDNLLNDDKNVSWFFTDLKDKDIAEEIGRLIDRFIHENRGEEG